MPFKNEVPLRGWREIMGVMGVKDRASAKRILIERKILFYEKRRPCMFFSDYFESSKKLTE